MTSFARAVLLVLVPIPALLVGVLVMWYSDVSQAIWGQQLAAGLTLMVLCFGFGAAQWTTVRTRPWARAVVGSAALLLLASTLVQPDVDGVRRWISLGPLQLHAAFVTLPILLIALCATKGREPIGSGAWLFPMAAALAGGVLVLQPDASQAAAFAVAIVVVLLQHRRPHVSDWAAGGIVVSSAVLALWRHDPLEAVPHVEGILGLAANLGAGWLIASALALGLLPLPFISAASRRRKQRSGGFALAAYVGTVCAAPFLEPYPVPILGYGLSPLVGYFAALAWIIPKDAAETTDPRGLTSAPSTSAAD